MKHPTALFQVQIFNTVGDLRNLTQNACANRLCNEVPDFQLVCVGGHVGIMMEDGAKRNHVIDAF